VKTNRITIRRATLDDRSVVRGLMTEFARELYQTEPDAAESDRAIGRILADPELRSWFLIAERDGRPLGQLRVQSVQDDLTCRETWHVGRVFVRADARRSGAAKALLAAVRDHAARAGNVASLACFIHHWNTASIRLHEQAGGFRLHSQRYTCPIP
jgi:RimJ/RimL family protein N-acetyltransferase